MKIGIDIRALIKGRRTGVEEYIINLLNHLIPLDESIKYVLFYNGLTKAKIDFDFLKYPNVKVKEMNIPNKILDLLIRVFNFPKIDKILGKIDVFFSPHFILAPVSKKVKKVLVFYDLGFIRFPEFFSFKKLAWHISVGPKKQAQKADKIIAISESTKNDLIDLFKIDKDKIKVIYPGISDKFKKIKSNIAEKYNLPDKFILYLATIEPRKNVLGLIKAFEKLKRGDLIEEYDINWKGFEGMVKTKKSFDFSEYKLVIAGSKGWLYKEIFDYIENSKFKDQIVFTDFIQENDKEYLYNLAEIFVYPSFFEGFGLPPLEAMACSVPVIVSNRSSLPEVVGDCAIMIDPNNSNEIAFAIESVLKYKELKDYLINKGIERAKDFKWDKKAREVLKVLIEK
ncbi:glycosyltransferase family 4 protein [Patescibacteria group bacterium]|nr:glycosyltransferase family 4 protein [Patescibacteria group bacterium]